MRHKIKYKLFSFLLGIRLWNADLKINDNPIEAGVTQTLRSEGDYLGREAVEQVQTTGPKKRHAFFTIEE